MKVISFSISVCKDQPISFWTDFFRTKMTKKDDFETWFFFNRDITHTKVIFFGQCHGLRTPNEGINQRYLKNWADVADKICCRHT